MRIIRTGALALGIALILGTVASIAQTPRPDFPIPVVQANEALAKQIDRSFGSVAGHEPAMPTTVRLPSTDARLGYWLEAQGPSATASYLQHLAERQIERASVRVAYPVLAGTENRHEQFRLVYEWFGSSMDRVQMETVVEVSPQFTDENYHRGVGAPGQCDGDVVLRFAEFASDVAAIMQPEYLILDLKPSTMAASAGCASFSDSKSAAELLSAVLESLEESLELPDDTRLGVSVDLVRDAEFRHSVLDQDGEFFVAVSTINDDLTVAELKRHLQGISEDAAGKGRSLALNEFWLRKHALIEGENLGKVWSSATADLWEIWRQADAALLNAVTAYLADEWLYVSAYETDLVIGGYVSSEWLADSAAERPIKVRRLSSLRSREIRHATPAVASEEM